jgi:hypothetical protein
MRAEYSAKAELEVVECFNLGIQCLQNVFYRNQESDSETTANQRSLDQMQEALRETVPVTVEMSGSVAQEATDLQEIAESFCEVCVMLTMHLGSAEAFFKKKFHRLRDLLQRDQTNVALNPS